MLTALALGVTVGFLLGFFGGGGSLLAVPALVWGVGLAPQVSIAVSLAVVAPAAALGGATHARAGNVALRTAALFGAPAIAASYLAALLGRHIPDRPLLAGFSLLAAAAAVRMFLRPPVASDLPPNTPRAMAAGAVVGSITGLFGVGGGFIAVPALLLGLKLPMSKAVGTSLVVVAATAIAGLLARVADLYFDPVLIGFGGMALLGVVGGSVASRLIRPDRLRKGFAVVLILVAVGTIVEALHPATALAKELSATNARMVVTDAV